MATITEDYVSYETAKLLKEKGFDEKCSRWYVVHESQEGIVEKGFGENQFYINAPTQQMAMAWLREVHKIYITISPVSGKGYGAILCDVGDFDDFNYIGETDYFFHPEEAVEAAIKYALENLI